MWSDEIRTKEFGVLGWEIGIHLGTWNCGKFYGSIIDSYNGWITKDKNVVRKKNYNKNEPLDCLGC